MHTHIYIYIDTIAKIFLSFIKNFAHSMQLYKNNNNSINIKYNNNN